MLTSFDIRESEFQHISSLVHDFCGINLHDGKKELVRARLSKRLRELGLKNFREYIDYVEHDSTQDEFIYMLDSLSTNLTSFFREDNHFTYLTKTIIPQWMQDKHNKEIRIWSAGCSSGEEPYTIAIILQETKDLMKTKNVKILATDISTKVLSMAKGGMYHKDRLQKVSANIMREYFEKGNSNYADYHTVKSNLREMIKFARLNLLGTWPMTGKFDLIFCRNVMIYFDKPTQEKLINRYWQILKPEGHLFVGHSESLTGVQHNFKYVQPTMYRKV